MKLDVQPVMDTTFTPVGEDKIIIRLKGSKVQSYRKEFINEINDALNRVIFKEYEKLRLTKKDKNPNETIKR